MKIFMLLVMVLLLPACSSSQTIPTTDLTNIELNTPYISPSLPPQQLPLVPTIGGKTTVETPRGKNTVVTDNFTDSTIEKEKYEPEFIYCKLESCLNGQLDIDKEKRRAGYIFNLLAVYNGSKDILEQDIRVKTFEEFTEYLRTHNYKVPRINILKAGRFITMTTLETVGSSDKPVSLKYFIYEVYGYEGGKNLYKLESNRGFPLDLYVRGNTWNIKGQMREEFSRDERCYIITNIVTQVTNEINVGFPDEKHPLTKWMINDISDFFESMLYMEFMIPKDMIKTVNHSVFKKNMYPPEHEIINISHYKGVNDTSYFVKIYAQGEWEEPVNNLFVSK